MESNTLDISVSNTSWPTTYILDVTDMDVWDFYQFNWTVYEIDILPTGLPDHDPTSPLTHYDYPLYTYSSARISGFDRFFYVNHSRTHLTDGRWCPEPNPYTESYQYPSTMTFFNSSLFDIDEFGQYMCAEWFDPGGNSGDIYVKAYGAKFNSTGNWVGFYIHGTYNPLDEVYIGLTVHVTDWTPYDQQSCGEGKHFDNTFGTGEYTINATLHAIPPNGRWVWFKVSFFAGYGHISFEVNHWESEPYNDMMDSYETLRVHYIYELIYKEYPVYVTIVNGSGALRSFNVTREGGRWKWNFFDMRWNSSITNDTYTFVLGDYGGNTALTSRNMTIIKYDYFWAFEHDTLYYGVKNDIDFRCVNYKYWSNVLDYYHPSDGEAQGKVEVVSLPTGAVLSNAAVTFLNDSYVMDSRDILGEFSGIIADPSSLSSLNAQIKLYILNNEGNFTLMKTENVTLTSPAMFIGGFEEVAFILGLPARLVRMTFALAIAAVVTIISTRWVSGFGAALVFLVVLLASAIMGWFPVWIPGMGVFAMMFIYMRTVEEAQ